MNGAGLCLDNIVISRGKAVLVALSASVAPGEILTVTGPSGSGKSTLLAFLTGTLGPPFRARGTIRLGGRDIGGLPPHRRRLGILFQDDVLFPHLSVGGNLAFGLRPEVRGRAARRAAVEAALAEAGMAGFADRDPASLSGGQRTRVALMRVLLSGPQALLLDEPFSSLDAARRDRIRAFVFAHARERGLPTLLVTHDPADADAAAGQVVHLRGADDPAP
jgi:putative thiamine transport system ATP-binding protein